LETIFWVKILKFFDADPGSGMEKFGSGILDSATLLTLVLMGGILNDPESRIWNKSFRDPTFLHRTRNFGAVFSSAGNRKIRL
jgi:hypothetical protein